MTRRWMMRCEYIRDFLERERFARESARWP